MFKKGELVKVVRFGCMYESYEEWMDKNAPEYKSLWRDTGYGMPPLHNGDEVVYLKSAPHCDRDSVIINLVLIVEKAQVIMIGNGGIEKISYEF